MNNAGNPDTIPRRKYAGAIITGSYNPR